MRGAEYLAIEDVPGTKSDEVIMKEAAWDPDHEVSGKYSWRDRRGHRSRGGEIPIAALPQMVRLAAKTGCMSRAEVMGLFNDLARILAE